MSLNASQILQRASTPDALLKESEVIKQQRILEDSFKDGLLNDDLTAWLANPLTVLLINALNLKAQDILHQALGLASVQDSEVLLRSNLTKAKTIQEIIAYARNRKW